MSKLLILRMLLIQKELLMMFQGYLLMMLRGFPLEKGKGLLLYMLTLLVTPSGIRTNIS